MRIYTRTGDDGSTGLQGGSRVPKTDSRIAAYGDVDEANSVLGMALSYGLDEDITETLRRIQNDLFTVGADLSNPGNSDDKYRVSDAMITWLETEIDRYDAALPVLESFVLPGGTTSAATLHHARTVLRRAERMTAAASLNTDINPKCVTYLNRASDILFVLARTLNARTGGREARWPPADSGSQGFRRI